MGRIISNTTDLFQVVRQPAGSAVVANDLLMNSESGAVYPIIPSFPLSSVTNTTAYLTVQRGPANMETSSNYAIAPNTTQTTGQTVVSLGSGDVAYVFSGDGTTNTTNINVRIRTLAGGDVVPRVTVATPTSVSCVRIVKISATQFAVAWSESGAVVKFAILNNSGSIAVAATTVATLASSNGTYWGVNATSSGDLVFAYQKVTSTDFAFKRFNASGALQGSETVIEAACGGQYPTIIACANGDFVIRYKRVTATAASKFARYNSSGVIQGSLVTCVTNSGGFSNSDQQSYGAELTGGNIVFADIGTGDQYTDLKIYNSSNTLVATVDLGTLMTASTAGSIVPLPNGNFAVFCASGSLLCWMVTPTGGIVNYASVAISGVTMGTASISTLIRIIPIGAAGFAFFIVGFDATNYSARVGTLNGTTFAQTSNSVIEAATATQIFGADACLTAMGTLVTHHSPGTTTHSDSHSLTCRSSILGVALDTAAAGTTVRVATKGTFTTNAAYSSGVSFDSRTATCPGTKGVVVGSSATLLGLS